jgi:hypothetical protein
MQNEVLFTFNTVRDAIRAEKALIDASVPVRVMPMPEAIGPRCGMCIRVDPPDRERALSAIPVAIKQVYTVRDTGNGKTYTPLQINP